MTRSKSAEGALAFIFDPSPLFSGGSSSAILRHHIMKNEAQRRVPPWESFTPRNRRDISSFE
jgi:hypothetical protein